MLTYERHQIIRQLLLDDTVVKLQDFVVATNSSESTIRRDLTQLEQAGELIRVHGGAKRNFSIDQEPSVVEKANLHLNEKDAIAKYAASLIKDNDVIFMDAGTTTVAMIPYIQAKKITIVTNSLDIANQLLETPFSTILIGGTLKASTRAMVGADANKLLEIYQFSKAFMGTNGIDTSFGFTTPEREEANIKALAIKHTNQAYILADISKFNKVTFCKMANLDEATIITNKMPKELKGKFEQHTTMMEV